MSILSSPPIRFSGDKTKCHNLSSRALTLYKTVVSAADRAGLNFISRVYTDPDGSTFSFTANRGGYDSWNGTISINGIANVIVFEEETGRHGFIYINDSGYHGALLSYKDEDSLSNQNTFNIEGGCLDWVGNKDIVTWDSYYDSTRYRPQSYLDNPHVYLNGVLYDVGSVLINRAILGCAYKNDIMVIFASDDYSNYGINYFFFKNNILLYTNNLGNYWANQLVCINKSGTNGITKVWNLSSSTTEKWMLAIDYESYLVETYSTESTMYYNVNKGEHFPVSATEASYLKTRTYSHDPLFICGDWSNDSLIELYKDEVFSYIIDAKWKVVTVGAVSTITHASTLNNTYAANFYLNSAIIGTSTVSNIGSYVHTEKNTSYDFIEVTPGVFENTKVLNEDTIVASHTNNSSYFSIENCDLRYNIMATGSHTESSSSNESGYETIDEVVYPLPDAGTISIDRSSNWNSLFTYTIPNTSSTSEDTILFLSNTLYNTSTSGSINLLESSWATRYVNLASHTPYDTSSDVRFLTYPDKNAFDMMISDYYGNTLVRTKAPNITPTYFILDNKGVLKPNSLLEVLKVSPTYAAYSTPVFIAGF